MEHMLGFVMDNTSANVAAMKTLEEQVPTLICMGCLAHALNLLFKDLQKEKYAPGMAPFYQAVQAMSLVICDNESIRTLLLVSSNLPMTFCDLI